MFSSFLLIDGHAPAISAHRNRLAAFGPITQLDTTPLHQPGQWNPKIMWDGTQWHIEMRTARPRTTTVDIHGCLRDQRQAPTIKGVDIAWLESTLGPGRSEALLLDDAGRVIEATYSCPVVFEHQRLWISSHPRALRSTTATVLCPIVEAMGFQLRFSSNGFDPTWMMQYPTLLLNAFHGAREVRHWGATAAAPSPVDVSLLNRRLWSYAEDVDKLSAHSNGQGTLL